MSDSICLTLAIVIRLLAMLFVLCAQGALQTLWAQSYPLNNAVMVVKPLRNQEVNPDQKEVFKVTEISTLKPIEI